MSQIYAISQCNTKRIGYGKQDIDQPKHTTRKKQNDKNKNTRKPAEACVTSEDDNDADSITLQVRNSPET